jgi:hypothetical protein
VGKVMGSPPPDLRWLDQPEARWMFDRMRRLLLVDDKTPAEATAIVAEEAKARPWIVPEQRG